MNADKWQDMQAVGAFCGIFPMWIRPMVRAAPGAKMRVMKTKRKQHTNPSADPQPMEDPFYGHSEWVDAGMKQTVSQEERRMPRHRGKTIRRPEHVARTMGS